MVIAPALYRANLRSAGLQDPAGIHRIADPGRLLLGQPARSVHCRPMAPKAPMAPMAVGQCERGRRPSEHFHILGVKYVKGETFTH